MPGWRKLEGKPLGAVRRGGDRLAPDDAMSSEECVVAGSSLGAAGLAESHRCCCCCRCCRLRECPLDVSAGDTRKARARDCGRPPASEVLVPGKLTGLCAGLALGRPCVVPTRVDSVEGGLWGPPDGTHPRKQAKVYVLRASLPWAALGGS